MVGPRGKMEFLEIGASKQLECCEIRILCPKNTSSRLNPVLCFWLAEAVGMTTSRLVTVETDLGAEKSGESHEDWDGCGKRCGFCLEDQTSKTVDRLRRH
jgi:hypothetical protein